MMATSTGRHSFQISDIVTMKKGTQQGKVILASRDTVYVLWDGRKIDQRENPDNLKLYVEPPFRTRSSSATNSAIRCANNAPHSGTSSPKIAVTPRRLSQTFNKLPDALYDQQPGKKRKIEVDTFVSKLFEGFGWYDGKVVSIWNHEDGREMFHVKYDADDDEEDYESVDIVKLVNNYKRRRKGGDADPFDADANNDGKSKVECPTEGEKSVGSSYDPAESVSNGSKNNHYTNTSPTSSFDEERGSNHDDEKNLNGNQEVDVGNGNNEDLCVEIDFSQVVPNNIDIDIDSFVWDNQVVFAFDQQIGSNHQEETNDDDDDDEQSRSNNNENFNQDDSNYSNHGNTTSDEEEKIDGSNNGSIPELDGDNDEEEANSGSRNDQLDQLQRKHEADTRLFEHMNLAQFLESNNLSADDALKVELDADSFVFVADALVDVGGALNKLTGIDFVQATTKVRPKYCRPSIASSAAFRPTREGAILKTPTTLCKFPSFTVGKVMFGELPLWLSIHIIDKNKVGQECKQCIVDTWNAVNNWALRKCSEDDIVKLVRDDSLANTKKRTKNLDTLVAEFARANSGTRKLGQGPRCSNKIAFYDKSLSLLHMDLIWYRLFGIASGNQLQEADCDSAYQIMYNSVFLLQNAGFKKVWRQTLALQAGVTVERRCDICPCQDPTGYNQWLREQVEKTHKAARTIFIDDFDSRGNRDRDHNDSSSVESSSSSHESGGSVASDTIRLAIDIAITIECRKEYDWHILPLGKVAETTVNRATQKKFGSSPLDEEPVVPVQQEPATSLDEAEESDNEEEELNEGEVFDPAADQNIDSEEPEHVFLGCPADPDDEVEEANNSDQESDDQSNSHSNNDTAGSSASLLGRICEAIVTSSQKERTTYFQFMTSGIIGNAQSKRNPIHIKATNGREIIAGRGPTVMIEHIESNKMSPQVQAYNPEILFMIPPKKSKIAYEASKLCPLMLRMASEFERSLLPDGNMKNEQESFCETLQHLFDLSTDFLVDMQPQNFHVRYEMTFVTSVDKDDVEVPLMDTISPINCLAFVKKEELHKTMKNVVEMNKEILGKLLDVLKNHLTMLPTITPSQWTACIAAMESLAILFGLSGGGKGTLLKASLEKAAFSGYFDTHFWTIHPSFLRLPATRGEGIPPAGLDLQFEVDHTLLALPRIPRLQNSEDGSPRIQMISALLESSRLSPRLLVGLPKLRHRSAVRNTCALIYDALLQASKDDEAEGALQEALESGTLYDAVGWNTIGKTPQTTSRLLDDVATALLAYHKLEASNRLVTNLKKALKGQAVDGFCPRKLKSKDWSECTASLGDAHTHGQLQQWKDSIEARLGASFPQGMCNIAKLDNEGLQKPLRIFVNITGLRLEKKADEIPISTALGQGWKVAGYGFILQFIRDLFDKATNVSNDTLVFYGGQNPFHDWKFVQHHLAVAVQNMDPDAPCIVWNTMPSKLEASWRFHEVQYNVENGLAAAINRAQQTTTSTETNKLDNLAFDSFEGQFLALGIINERQAEIELLTALGFVTSDANVLPACNRVSEICALQAAIFWLCQNDGRQPRLKMRKEAILAVGFVDSVFMPNDHYGKLFKTFNLKIGIGIGTFNNEMMKDHEGAWGYEDLYRTLLLFLAQSSRFKKLDGPEQLEKKANFKQLFDCAVRQLKPPQDLKSAASLSAGWKSDAETDRLQATQAKALKDCDYRLAFVIYSCYGIGSEELIQHITHLRQMVRHHTALVRNKSTPDEIAEASKCAESEFAKYKIEGSRKVNNWNFAISKSTKDK